MRPRKPFPPGAAERLNALMNRAKNVAEFKRVQSVWLRAALDMPVEQIAQATGLAPSSVRCYHSRYMKGGESVLLGPGRGGRRRQNLTVAQESEVLSGFEAEALQGGVLEVREIRVAYDPSSTVVFWRPFVIKDLRLAVLAVALRFCRCLC